MLNHLNQLLASFDPGPCYKCAGGQPTEDEGRLNNDNLRFRV